MCIRDSHGAIGEYAKVAALKQAYQAAGAYVLLADAGFGEMHSYTIHEPVGVVGLITPWNYPFLMGEMCIRDRPTPRFIHGEDV